MQVPSEVWLNILEYTNISKDVKEFVSLRSVCRLFYDICTDIGTPINYHWETLQALSPLFAQTTNYMSFKKPLTKDLIVPEKIRNLRFPGSGDPNVTITGNYLDELQVINSVGKDNLRSLPKIRFRKIKSLISTGFDIQEDTFLPSAELEELYLGDAEFRNLPTSFFQSLRVLSFSYFSRPILSVNNFSNLVVISTANLQNLTFQHLPKLMLLQDCSLGENFFNKTVTVISKEKSADQNYTCTENTRFYADKRRNYVVIVNNFNRKYAHFLPKERFLLEILGLWPWHEPYLLAWIKHMQVKDSTIRIKRNHMGFRTNSLEDSLRRELPLLEVTST
ncbi:F-box domain-containing protein [Brazilian cedratvirus IHUMI]|uniref:F-box domain-containing protein n=1 Tax=Brazilian cedratvirus IHUMI TaxID=2126980 RepID=A0A2R8FF39_9VIRU|nr:F-box domain-containing protein [Brazilian cedratvirus IHUMI]